VGGVEKACSDVKYSAGGALSVDAVCSQTKRIQGLGVAIGDSSMSERLAGL
jgi:hypothetical protein